MGKSKDKKKNTKKEEKSKKYNSELQDLTEDQLVCLKEMQKRFSKDLSELEAKYCDIPCLIRYLIAREWDVDQSEEMLKESLKWRKEFKPHEITAKDIEEEGKTGKMYVHGCDVKGRPIVIMRPERENTTNGEQQLKYLVYTLERAISMMKDGVSQIVWVISFTHFSMLNAPSVNQSMDVIKVLSNHYPERLALCYMYDTPWIFSLFWKSVSGFINQRTASKVVMISSGTAKDEKEKTMRENFDSKQLEKDLSGECDFSFDSKKYFEEDKRHNLEKIKL